MQAQIHRTSVPRSIDQDGRGLRRACVERSEPGNVDGRDLGDDTFRVEMIYHLPAIALLDNFAEEQVVEVVAGFVRDEMANKGHA